MGNEMGCAAESNVLTSAELIMALNRGSDDAAMSMKKVSSSVTVSKKVACQASGLSGGSSDADFLSFWFLDSGMMGCSIGSMFCAPHHETRWAHFSYISG